MSSLKSRSAAAPRGGRRLSDLELASLGIAYLAGEPIEQLVDRFRLRDVGSLRWHIGKIALKHWQAQRRCALSKRGELSTLFGNASGIWGRSIVSGWAEE